MNTDFDHHLNHLIANHVCHTHGNISPATSMEDAWKIVEYMRKKKFLAANIMPTSSPIGSWYVSFIDIGDDNEDDFELTNFTALADTVPRAICMAVLQSMGVKYDAP